MADLTDITVEYGWRHREDDFLSPTPWLRVAERGTHDTITIKLVCLPHETKEIMEVLLQHFNDRRPGAAQRALPPTTTEEPT